MFVISILTEHATSLFELHVSALMNVFGSVLTKPEYYGSPLAYLTVISMKNFLLCFTTKDKTVGIFIRFLFALLFILNNHDGWIAFHRLPKISNTLYHLYWK